MNGKNILIIGCEPRKAEFMRYIEGHGGNFMFAEGNESQNRIESLIHKANVVILIKRFLSHPFSGMCKSLCKKHNISFSSIETVGLDTLLEEIKITLNSRQKVRV